MVKQINLTIPDVLFDLSNDYSKNFGYLNLQEFILDLVRKKVILGNIEKYREIEEKMKNGKSVKRFSQKGAVSYLRGL